MITNNKIKKDLVEQLLQDKKISMDDALILLQEDVSTLAPGTKVQFKSGGMTYVVPGLTATTTDNKMPLFVVDGDYPITLVS